MQINWTVILIVGVLLVALVVFIIIRNNKDRKDLEHKLNEDYRKSKETEHTIDSDDVKGS